MDILRGAKHRLGDTYRSVVSTVLPVSGESRFVESGTLTPEEFVEAGDQLIFKFPTWQWAEGDPARSSSYLPKDKQYLITKGVPCRDRVRALDYVLSHHTRTEDEWTLPETAACQTASGPQEIRDVDDLSQEVGASGGITGVEAEESASGGGIIVAQEDFLVSSRGGDALPDFSDLDAQLVEEDTDAARASSAVAQGIGDKIVADAPDAHIVRSRTYDLSITYDKYYQTPRLWLFGYDEEQRPLRPEEVYEDVLSEYVKKTVTVDPHPLTGTPTVSIHPCKHAQVMKKVVQDWIENGITPRHDLAIFVFLKFISGIVPTINYDFTMDIEF
eukprot:TRINITY_DN71564_c0_g1_i1.p1 TRINITY_DN71564_c0_g1~~TRINITY_DN71564_c0_g1_i1.p1  ORF type:complete len:358 (-),score=67.97 TRINITY_DN71564_c0_g1_i1:94-1083(-)